MTQPLFMKRRGFLGLFGAAGAIGASQFASKLFGAIETNPQISDEIKATLENPTESFPMLQRPEPNAISAVWSTLRPATGWIEWGETSQLGRTARRSVGGLFPYEERFLSATMTGLEPGKTYYYRTVTRGAEFPRYGKLFLGDPQASETFSFTMPDAAAPTGTFAVVNDTHENYPSLDAISARIEELSPDCVVWNGDLLNDTNSADQAVAGILQSGTPGWLAKRPILLSAGNHDHRGPWARKLTQIFLPRCETSEKYRSLIYNFALRVGPIALVGLDTGEDKPDFHPIWEGLADFDALRVLQAEWLEETLSRPEISSAPFVVVCCHIPLFSSDPQSNPGEILDGWASWQSRCAELWTPILNRHKVQALIVGHLHDLRDADLPDENRVWTQIHGGGCSLERNTAVIHGAVEDGVLVIRRSLAKDFAPMGEWRFAPRAVE